MYSNFKVAQQWLALLLGLGSVEVQHISRTMIKELLGRFYLLEEIWIQEAVYIPSLGVLQVVAQVPRAHYLPSAPHITKEQYVRVQTQSSVLIAMLSDNVPERIRQMSAQDFTDNLYYRQEDTHWRRLVRPDDPFVCQFRISVRDLRGNTEFTIQMADGPFEGRIKAVFIPRHSSAEAEKGLEGSCYDVWRSVVDSLVSRFAFTLARHHFIIKPISRSLVPQG